MTPDDDAPSPPPPPPQPPPPPPPPPPGDGTEAGASATSGLRCAHDETTGAPLPRRRAGKEALKKDLDTQGAPTEEQVVNDRIQQLSAMTLEFNQLAHQAKLEGGINSTEDDRKLLAAAGTLSRDQPVLQFEIAMSGIEQAMKNVLFDLKEYLGNVNLSEDELANQCQETILRIRLLDFGGGGALRKASAPAMTFAGAVVAQRVASDAGKNHKKDKTKAKAKARTQELQASKRADVEALKGIKAILLEATNLFSSLIVNAQSNRWLLNRDYFAALTYLRQQNEFYQKMVCQSPARDTAVKNAAIFTN